MAIIKLRKTFTEVLGELAVNLDRKKFKDIDLSDKFFDSLKESYAEFPDWFAKKSNENAYVILGNDGSINGFLYLKVEEGQIADVEPQLPAAKRLKVGTMKINAHGTKLGERFIKKIFDHALFEGVTQVYLTVFEQHTPLINLIEKYGFEHQAKKTTENGTELVYVKDLSKFDEEITKSYPLVSTNGSGIYLLSLYPQWHTRLLPDSILNNENSDVVQDISHTNSIHKVYLTAMKGVESLERGDILLIYRTSDGKGPARFRSVATSICVVEEYKSIRNFKSEDEFLSYCRPYSVFTEIELDEFWKTKKYPHIIKFTYNLALKKRPNRAALIDLVGLESKAYWGFMKISKKQFEHIISLGAVNESLIVD